MRPWVFCAVLKTCPGLLLLEAARHTGVRFRRLNEVPFRLLHKWAHTCRCRSRGPQDYDIPDAAVDALCDQRLENLSGAGVDGGRQVLRGCLGILECLHKQHCHQIFLKALPDSVRCRLAARCCRCNLYLCCPDVQNPPPKAQLL